MDFRPLPMDRRGVAQGMHAHSGAGAAYGAAAGAIPSAASSNRLPRGGGAHRSRQPRLSADSSADESASGSDRSESPEPSTRSADLSISAMSMSSAASSQMYPRAPYGMSSAGTGAVALQPRPRLDAPVGQDDLRKLWQQVSQVGLGQVTLTKPQVRSCPTLSTLTVLTAPPLCASFCSVCSRQPD
jgi:hypothetical protein